MKILFHFFTMVAFLFFTITALPSAWAQTDDDAQAKAAAVEELAAEIGENIDATSESIDQWLEANQDELEQWAQQHGKQWEQWAEQFEQKFSRWAEDQEQVWEQWAEQYSKRWEDWGRQLESEKFDPDELGEIIHRNLEMLGEMPLGQLIDGALKQSTEQLESAPWESIEDLHAMIRHSLEQSVEKAERELAEATNRMQDAAGRMKELEEKAEQADEDAEFILPVVEKLQESMKSKKEFMDTEMKARLKELKQKLASVEDLKPEEAKKLIAELIKAVESEGKRSVSETAAAQRADKDGNKARAEKARAIALERAIQQAQGALKGKVGRMADEQKRKAIEEAIRAKLAEREAKALQRQASKSMSESDESDAGQQDAVAAKRRMNDLLEALAQTELESKSSKESFKQLYEALAKEQKRIQQKDDQLQSLKEEIKKLKQEVSEMKQQKDK